MIAPLLLALFVASQAASPAQPALSKEEMAHFLETAKVIAHHDIPRGVTNPVRLTLSDGTVTHDAEFTFVDEHRSVMKLESGRTELDFVDSYQYTLAAYALAGLLGLDGMMPVIVAREWDNRPGAFSWWLDVKWDEGQRLKAKVEPPDQDAWARQTYRMRVFSALVADSDRNAGNILISEDWKIWMIDHTRAFRLSHDLRNPSSTTQSCRGTRPKLALQERRLAKTMAQLCVASRPTCRPAKPSVSVSNSA